LGRKDKQIPLKDIAALPLGAKMRYARQQKGISLSLLAEQLGYTKSHLSAVENGKGSPSRELVGKYEQALELEADVLIKMHNGGLLELGHRHTPLPLEGLENKNRVGTVDKDNDFALSLGGKERLEDSLLTHALPALSDYRGVGGVEAPSVGNFYGRKQELDELKRWIAHDNCQVIAILGMGGIGKSGLIAKLADEIEGQFTYVYWRSLQHAPALDNILDDYLRLFSQGTHADSVQDEEDKIARLIRFLRQHRSLLVLDNFESVLQGGNKAGQYRNGFENYGELIRRLGEINHESCLVLTSREKPREFARLEGRSSPVRSMQLPGLKPEEARKILQNEGLFSKEDIWDKFIELYSGNPLALKLAAEPVRELFQGDIAAFLRANEAVVGDIHDLLDQQFERLSPLEQEIMFWLAINREGTSLDSLLEDIARLIPNREVHDALTSLRRRSMVETNSISQFTLQPVIMEYVTSTLVNQVYNDFCSKGHGLFTTHALIKAQAKDYVRKSQETLILKPLVQLLLSSFGKEDIELELKSFLSSLREISAQKTGYAAGNVLNILIELGTDIEGYDFSRLNVWQAYLQGVPLPEVNFAYSDLAKSVFTDTFGIILSVAFSPDGKLLAAGTANGEIRLWQVSNNTPLFTYQAHTDRVWSLVFSPDSTILASGSSDYTVRLWNVGTGQCLHTISEHTNRVRSVTFNLDGSILASGSEDNTVRLWEVSTGRRIIKLEGHTNPVRSIAFNPVGKVLASGSDDKTVRLWEVNTGQCFITLKGHTSQVWAIAFSPNGQVLASGGDDKTVRLWEVKTGENLKILQEHSNWISSVAFSPDGTRLASGSADQDIRIWDVNKGQCVHRLWGHSNWVSSVTFSPDGTTLASGSHDQTVRLWDVTKGGCLKTLQGFKNPVWLVAFSPDGEILASGNGDRTLRLWDMNSGKILNTLEGHSTWIRTIAFSPNGQLLASGSDDQTVRLWDVQTGQCLNTLSGHTNRVWSIAFSPDGAILASGGHDQIVCLWDVQTGQHLKSLQEHTNRVRSIVFSPNGQLLASGSDDQTVRLWDVQTGQCLNTLSGHTNRVWSIAFSPDGAILASGSEDQTVRLWDVQTGRCLNTLMGHSLPVWSVIFNPNGHMLASCSEDQNLRLWDSDKGVCIGTLEGHAKPIWSIAFSPDGKFLISGSYDHTVRLWEVSTQHCLKILQGHTDSVLSVAFNVDGRIIASGSNDETIRLWDASAGECFRIMGSNKLYKHMNIKGMTGVSEAQRAMLRVLGAIEDESK
jgi:WD40 repeat protein/transcriptional regulator with XRE-family HTH domain